MSHWLQEAVKWYVVTRWGEGKHKNGMLTAESL